MKILNDGVLCTEAQHVQLAFQPWLIEVMQVLDEMCKAVWA